MSPYADAILLLFAIGAVVGSGMLLLIGLAVGYRLGRNARSDDAAKAAAIETATGERIRALASHSDELHRLVTEHREAMRSWEAARQPADAAAREDGATALDDEFRKRHLELSRKIAFAEAQLHEQTAALTEVLRQARTDALTDVANRRSLDEALVLESELWRRSARPYGLAMIDIDHFKKLNDVFGHQTGDRALQHVAAVLRSISPSNSLLARYGGEEFALLLSNAKVLELRAVVREIRMAVESRPLPLPDGGKLRITVSIGAALAMESEIGEQTLARADAALYASKKAGRNCAHWHDGERPRLLDVGMDDAGDSTTGPGGDAADRAGASLDRLGRKALELFRMA